MSWSVEIGRDASKELSRLPAATQKRIARAILVLKAGPFPRGFQKLRNRDGYRLRVGDYRILYLVDAKARKIAVSLIGHRREVYRD